MILDVVLTPILYIFKWFISLFPVLYIPSELITSLTSFFNTLSSVNRYFPINEIFICFTIIFVIINSTTILYIINWLLNKILKLIPFIG